MDSIEYTGQSCVQCTVHICMHFGQCCKMYKVHVLKLSEIVKNTSSIVAATEYTE